MPRRPRRKNNLSVFILVILLIVLGVYYIQTGSDPLGIFTAARTAVSVLGTAVPNVEETVTILSSPLPSAPPNAAATPLSTAPQPPVSGNWWEVYFTDPVNVKDPAQWQNSIEGRLIEKINAAQESIHIVSFEFDLTPVAEALIAAKQRGVDVRWVTDDEHGLEADEEPGQGQFAMLQGAGIEVRSDTRSALMHNKFWIFDGEFVWTGSTNITVSGVFKQNNNTLVIHSLELAAIYEREFQEMWDGQFGPKSPSQLTEQSIMVEGSSIQVIFTSEDPAIEQGIIPIVDSAVKSIRFLAFSFTDFPLAEAMMKRAQDGVDVAGVFERVGSDAQGAELKTLFCAKVPARQDGNSSFMHNKVIIVDERFVITGSLNFSTSAEKSNDENVIIIDNTDIAKPYLQEFERIWALASDPQPGKFTCP